MYPRIALTFKLVPGFCKKLAIFDTDQGSLLCLALAELLSSPGTCINCDLILSTTHLLGKELMGQSKSLFFFRSFRVVFRTLSKILKK